MFIIEGMDKVRSVIEEIRKRKLTKHKKISTCTVETFSKAMRLPEQKPRVCQDGLGRNGLSGKYSGIAVEKAMKFGKMKKTDDKEWKRMLKNKRIL